VRVAQSQKDSTYTLLLRAYEWQTLIVRFFSLQFEFGYPLPAEHVRFLMDRILYGLIHSPFAQINVMVTLAICDADTELNRVNFCIFLDYVLPEKIQNDCSIFIVYHQRSFFLLCFSFIFPTTSVWITL